MRCVATSFGSAGDFLPTLTVARALHEAGHEVIFLTNPFHARQVRAAGLPLVTAGAHIDVFGELERNPVYLDAVNGSRALWNDFAVPYITTTYRALRTSMEDRRPDVVIGSNLSFGVFWAATERGIPRVMISATPLSWLTRNAPMQFLDQRVPEWLLPSLAGATRSLLVWTVDRWLRKLARDVHASVDDPSMTTTERDLALHLGMWPTLLREPAESDLPNMHACGFARAGHLGGTQVELPAEVEAFLAAGSPPVVVGLGSAFAKVAGTLLTAVAAACAELGRRCLVVGHPSDARSFPGETLAVKYAPYHLVFPRAAANVIHGGAGTTGEALRSGRPTVVMPLGYDQYALSWQVERVGAGVRVAKSNRSHEAIVEALARAITDEGIARKASNIARTLAEAPDGAIEAVRAIEQRVSRA